MKKQLLLLFLIFFGGVFFTALNKKDLKACCTNPTDCSVLQKREVKYVVPVLVEEADMQDVLINPLIN